MARWPRSSGRSVPRSPRSERRRHRSLLHEDGVSCREEDHTMAQPLSAEIKQLLDRPNFAHLATLMADGSPQSVPVWVGREGDRILVCTGEGSLKARNTRRDPRVALSIVDFRDPYLEVQLRGRVVGHLPDAGFLPARRAVRDSLTN